MSLLQRMHELPFDFVKDTFFRYANVITCCTGVEVSKRVADREEVDCIVPNIFLAWETYVDGQPEFTNGPPMEYLGQNIEWARHMLTEGQIQIRRHVLFIDAYNLLRFPCRETILAKKALLINLHFGICPLVVFKIWDRVDFSSTFSCVPVEMFHRQFGRILHNNPLRVEIAIDQYEKPRNVWDKARTTTPRFGINPIFLVDNLSERQAYVNWLYDLPSTDTSRSLQWYEQSDIGARRSLEHIPGQRNRKRYEGVKSIAGCKDWEAYPNVILLSR